MNTILYFVALIPLKSQVCFLAAAILFPAFQPGLKFHFDCMIEIFSDFLARLPGLKILAQFEQTGQGFSAWTELSPRLNPSPCNQQFDFNRICFRSLAEISAWAEICHVIGPLISFNRPLLDVYRLSQKLNFP